MARRRQLASWAGTFGRPAVCNLPMMRTRPLLLAALACLLTTAAAPALADAATVRKAFWAQPEQFPTLQELGVDIVEASLDWSQVAPTRPADATNPNDPAYHWPRAVEGDVPQAQAYGMAQTLMISKTPEWASGNPDPRFPPTSTSDFTDFLIAVSRRYPSVRHWMIWSEACSHTRFQPITLQGLGTPVTSDARFQPRPYAQLLDASYVTLKGLSRRNVVIGGSTWAVCDIRPIDWAHYLKMPNGRRPRMDMWGHNPFVVYPPRKVPEKWKVSDIYRLSELQDAIDHYFGKPHHKKIRLFLSEFEMPTGPDQDIPIHTSEGGQARFVKQAFQQARKVGAYALGWLYLQDQPVPAGGTEGKFGGLLRPDGTRKPAFDVFRRE
ncbi:MAG: hypothetical protein ACJ77L_11180 [Solirubrobacteraceae bacterium]